MQIDAITAAIQTAIPNSAVNAHFEGSHVHLRVVSEAFAGLNPVKKQQLVYGALSAAIASGAIHAVHMQTLTPAEAAQQA